MTFKVWNAKFDQLHRRCDGYRLASGVRPVKCHNRQMYADRALYHSVIQTIKQSLYMEVPGRSNLVEYGLGSKADTTREDSLSQN